MNLRTVFIGAAVACATLLTMNATSTSIKHSATLSDLAELDHIRYGIFDPAQWVQRVTDALSVKLEDLRRQPLATNELRAGVEALIRDHLEVQRTRYLKAHGGNTGRG